MSSNQITQINDERWPVLQTPSNFLKDMKKNHAKMEVSERKYQDGSLERTIKLFPLTTGDYVGIWAAAALKSLLLILFAVMVFEIYKDVQAHINLQKTKAQVEQKNCIAEYDQNQCHEHFLIESMAQKCQELEVCINQNIDMKVRTQQLWLQVVGNSLENMLKSLSIKSSIVIVVLACFLSIIFIKN